MAAPEQHERGGMPLWAMAAVLSAAGLSFLARVPLVFPEGFHGLDRCLEWLAYGGFAAAAVLPVVGLAVARRKGRRRTSGGEERYPPRKGGL